MSTNSTSYTSTVLATTAPAAASAQVDVVANKPQRAPRGGKFREGAKDLVCNYLPCSKTGHKSDRCHLKAKHESDALAKRLSDERVADAMAAMSKAFAQLNPQPAVQPAPSVAPVVAAPVAAAPVVPDHVEVVAPKEGVAKPGITPVVAVVRGEENENSRWSYRREDDDTWCSVLPRTARETYSDLVDWWYTPREEPTENEYDPLYHYTLSLNDEPNLSILTGYVHFVMRMMAWVTLFPIITLMYLYYTFIVWGAEIVSRWILQFIFSFFVDASNLIYWANKYPFMYVQLGLLVGWLVLTYAWWYNMPVHYRNDRIKYTLLGRHKEYNKRLKTYGDMRAPGFRSVSADSEDYVESANYLRYLVEEIKDNKATSRIVVISQNAYNEMCLPINTLRWKEPDDFKNLRADTINFVRSACQRINMDPAIERESDCLFETITMFAWHMKAKRHFPTNFYTPKSE
jgi:hypothetical protein